MRHQLHSTLIIVEESELKRRERKHFDLCPGNALYHEGQRRLSGIPSPKLCDSEVNHPLPGELVQLVKNENRQFLPRVSDTSFNLRKIKDFQQAPDNHMTASKAGDLNNLFYVSNYQAAFVHRLGTKTGPRKVDVKVSAEPKIFMAHPSSLYRDSFHPLNVDDINDDSPYRMTKLLYMPDTHGTPIANIVQAEKNAKLGTNYSTNFKNLPPISIQDASAAKLLSLKTPKTGKRFFENKQKNF